MFFGLSQSTTAGSQTSQPLPVVLAEDSDEDWTCCFIVICGFTVIWFSHFMMFHSSSSRTVASLQCDHARWLLAIDQQVGADGPDGVGRSSSCEDDQSCGPNRGQVVYRLMPWLVVSVLGELECWGVTFSPGAQRWLHIVSRCSPSLGAGLYAQRPRHCEQFCFMFHCAWLICYFKQVCIIEQWNLCGHLGFIN